MDNNEETLINNARSYLNNFGGLVDTSTFDDDFAPMGMQVRDALVARGLAESTDEGRIIRLTP